MSDQTIAAVRDGTWRDCAELDAGDRAALTLAERMSETPPAVDDAAFEELRAHFDPGQIVELVAIAAWENYRARFNCALGIEGHRFYQPRHG